MKRVLLSEWMGIPLILAVFIACLFAVHDDRPSTPVEMVAVISTLGILGLWLGYNMFSKLGNRPRPPDTHQRRAIHTRPNDAPRP